ncbi:MAG: PilC/PilY family type IV pilus protein [Lautropia sp.]|nr:PilC/PilY family type IV pilus protein [Lautropia sp.]
MNSLPGSGLAASAQWRRRLPVRLIRTALWLMSSAMLGSAAHARMAQEPLIIKDKEPVEPNLMFVLDDSGSMMFNYLPDPDPRLVFSKDCAVSPDGCGEHKHIFAYHPGEPKGRIGERGANLPEGQRPYGIYIVEGLAGTDDRHLLGVRQRSAQVNALYYNPEITYQPWRDEKGAAMPDADPGKAIYHVGHRRKEFSQLTLNLRGEHPVGQYKVCTSPRPPIKTYTDLSVTTTPCTGDASITHVKPATYYELKKGPDGNYLRGDQVSHFTRVAIDEHQSFKRPWGTRTDCKVKPGDGEASKVITCSKEEEYRNFANWFQYHRTRMHVAIASVGLAFAEAVKPNVRVGYGRINKSSATEVDGIPTKVIEKGVRRFEGDHRAGFFRWLNGMTGDGGTPLMRAMQAAGEYYKRADERGPWSWKPGTGDSRPHLSCRRSYHILMTDGEYNFSYDRPGERQEDFNLEADNVEGDLIEGLENAQGEKRRYQYQPRAPFKGKAKGSLADYAAYYWKTDLRTDLPNEIPLVEDGVGGIENPSFWQNMTTFTMGFGVEGTLKKADWPALVNGQKHWPEKVQPDTRKATDDLWHAGVNGRGGYLDVKDSHQFLEQLKGVLGRIKGTDGNPNGIGVQSSTLQAGNKKFVPSFQTRKWFGDLKAYALDENGAQGEEIWSAVKKLPSPANRRMFVGTGATTGSKALPFQWSGNWPQPLRRALLEGAGLSDGNNQGSLLVNYLRGDASQEGTGKPFRVRERPKLSASCGAGTEGPACQGAQGGLLGHIVHSSPLYIGADHDRGYRFLPATFPGNKASGASTYREFVRRKIADSLPTPGKVSSRGPDCRANGQGTRPGLVFVGANDGFLHAFDADCGVERFAYAPHAVLREMARSSTSSFKPRFLMDGPLIEGDAYLNGAWANVLVGTTGAGPAAVFALDVTNTRANDQGLGARSVMWEIDAAQDDDLGHVLQRPDIGVLADGRWVVVFGNGYESRSGKPKLFVVELATGKVLAKLGPKAAGGASANGLGGVRLVRDGNHVITGAYAGDLNGNLWKFDLVSTRVSDWQVAFGGKPLFTTADNRPIVVAPTLVSHPHGGQMVLVGTGKLFEEGDNRPPRKGAAPVEALYGLWDQAVLSVNGQGERVWAKATTIPASTVKKRRVVLADGYATIPPDDAANRLLNWRVDRGWRIDQSQIPGGGQRSIVPAQMLSGLALFEMMTPFVKEESLPCMDEINTPSFTLVVDPLSGRMSTKSLIDTDQNGVIDAKDKTIAGWQVEDWKGSSVILGEAPPAPCSTRNCTQAARPTPSCPPNSLRNVIESATSAKTTCVRVDPPARWWWRELSLPDVDNSTGRLNTDTTVRSGGS